MFEKLSFLEEQFEELAKDKVTRRSSRTRRLGVNYVREHSDLTQLLKSTENIKKYGNN